MNERLRKAIHLTLLIIFLPLAIYLLTKGMFLWFAALAVTMLIIIKVLRRR